MPVDKAEIEGVATAVVDELFADLRDRRFLKWLFSPYPTLIGNLEGEELSSLDEDVQQEIKQAWSEIIARAIDAATAAEREALPDAIDLYRLLKSNRLRKRADIAHAIAAAIRNRGASK